MKNEFIDFLLASGSLLTGDFITKSGRHSPYFINTGMFYSGANISLLADFYAQKINEVQGVTAVFGPAYKGVPLCVSAVMALYRNYQKNISWVFNRKETKDHGEGGGLIGKKLDATDRVIIVDDVITSGLSIGESLATLKACGAPQICGIVIAVDRRERSSDGGNPLAVIEDKYKIPVLPIVNINEIISHLEKKNMLDEKLRESIRIYRETYGI
ncbi:MAG TPA: orotate phosphoribosyltransferase [Spirochaetia bacterium]|nr:orotate phosphoribosyltransferase [Spirochaetia bacterium]